MGRGRNAGAALLTELAARGSRSVSPRIRTDRSPARPRRAACRWCRFAFRNHLDLGAALALRRLVPGHDVVHFHTARAHALAPLCRGRGAGSSSRADGLRPTGGPYARFLYNRAVDAVIAISEGVRRRCCGSACVTTASGSCRARRRGCLRRAGRGRGGPPRAWGFTPDDVVVLVLGALERRKGHAVLLERRPAGGQCDAPRYVCLRRRRGSRRARPAATPLGASLVRFAGFRDDVAPASPPRHRCAASLREASGSRRSRRWPPAGWSSLARSVASRGGGARRDGLSSRRATRAIWRGTRAPRGGPRAPEAARRGGPARCARGTPRADGEGTLACYGERHARERTTARRAHRAVPTRAGARVGDLMLDSSCGAACSASRRKPRYRSSP